MKNLTKDGRHFKITASSKAMEVIKLFQKRTIRDPRQNEMENIAHIINKGGDIVH